MLIIISIPAHVTRQCLAFSFQLDLLNLKHLLRWLTLNFCHHSGQLSQSFGQLNFRAVEFLVSNLMVGHVTEAVNKKTLSKRIYMIYVTTLYM